MSSSCGSRPTRASPATSLQMAWPRRRLRGAPATAAAFPARSDGGRPFCHASPGEPQRRPSDTAQWIATHVPPERRHHPPGGSGLQRGHLHRARKALASRFYQLLSGHAAIGLFLPERMTGPRDWSRASVAIGDATTGRGNRVITSSLSAEGGPPRSGGCGGLPVGSPEGAVG